MQQEKNKQNACSQEALEFFEFIFLGIKGLFSVHDI